MFHVGLDLGQRRDHSAIAVVERCEQRRAFQPALLEDVRVRLVERTPLGTPYPMVVARVRSLVRSPELQGQCTLTVDGTGVGAPVVEMLRAAQLGCEINAVTITGGAHESAYRWGGGSGFNVPKQDLIAGLQVLLERGELRIASALRDLESLMRELQDMRGTQGGVGRIRMGADGAGEHDDSAMALALACWRAARKQLAFGTQRLTGI